jgi:hypothetical protein
MSAIRIWVDPVVFYRGQGKRPDPAVTLGLQGQFRKCEKAGCGDPDGKT